MFRFSTNGVIEMFIQNNENEQIYFAHCTHSLTHTYFVFDVIYVFTFIGDFNTWC